VDATYLMEEFICRFLCVFTLKTFRSSEISSYGLAPPVEAPYFPRLVPRLLRLSPLPIKRLKYVNVDDYLLVPTLLSHFDLNFKYTL
jgi:hypothetical protein